jgi:putative multiple sugar transport system permease protein
MNKVREYIKHNMRQYTMIIALVVIMVLFQWLTDGILLKPRNVSKLIYQNSYILILAIGMLLCILTGGNIDLSVGSVVALVSAMSGLLATTLALPVWLSIIIGLIVGLLAGMLQGLMIAYVKVPAFIVTLGGMLVFRGVNNLILKGMTIGLPKQYVTIAAGVVPDFIGGEASELNLTALAVGALFSVVYIAAVLYGRGKKKSRGYEVSSFLVTILKIAVIIAVINVFTYWLALDNGIPIILVILLVLIGIYTFITTKTIPGRHLYALGGNAKAAELSGIKTKQVLFIAYANMGLLSAVAGIVFAGRLNAATPTAGMGFELDAIASCFIGGASATGGVGTIIGAVIGGFIMGILNNGMSIMGVETFWQDIAKGLVLLAAVAFDVYSKSKSKSK